jgi:hypothetical protein
LARLKCNIADWRLAPEEKYAKYVPIAEVGYYGSASFFGKPMSQITAAVSPSALLTLTRGRDGHSILVHSDEVSFDPPSGLFQKAELSKVINQSAKDYGRYDLWKLHTESVATEFHTISISPMTNCSLPCILEDCIKKKIAILPFVMKLFSFPTVVASDASTNDSFEKRQKEFVVTPILTVTLEMDCFVISMITGSHLSVLNNLTGIEFAYQRPKTLAIGVNHLPGQALINVVALSFAVSDPINQAGAFLAAVLSSRVVILDTDDFAGFWRGLLLLSDVLATKFGLSLPTSEVEVLVLGTEQPIPSDIPASSIVSKLLQLCKFRFGDSPNCLKVSDNLPKTSAVLPRLRDSAALFGASADTDDVFRLSQTTKQRDLSEWLLRLAADQGNAAAEYSLATALKSDEWLRRAADHGYPEAQWQLYLQDPSLVNYLDQAAASGHIEAVIKKVADPSPILAKLGRHDRLFELLDTLSGQIALDEAKFWLPKDPTKALLLYRAAKTDDFPLYRSILLAYNSQFSPVEDTSELGLRTALDSGNKLAAAPLATLVDDPVEKKRILSLGLPTQSAFFGLAALETEGDLIYEYARDGLLAGSCECSEVQHDYVEKCFSGEIAVSDPAKVRLEVARLLTDGEPNGFVKNPDVVLSKPQESDDPEYCLIWAGMTDDVGVCLQAVNRATGVIRGGLEFLLARLVPGREKEYIMAAAEDGFPEAQSQYALSVVQAHDPDDAQKSLALRCFEERSRDEAEVACRYCWGLFLAGGAWGVGKDLRRAWELWRGIGLAELRSIGIDAEFFRPALPSFCEFLVETAESDTDHVHALQHLAQVIGEENSDEELKMLLLKRVYLDVRVNMVIASPKDLDALLDYYEKSDPELCMTIAEKWFKGEGGTQTALGRRLEAFMNIL